jgi:hypothetical protein
MTSVKNKESVKRASSFHNWFRLAIFPLLLAGRWGSSPNCVGKCIMIIQKQEVQYVDKLG